MGDCSHRNTAEKITNIASLQKNVAKHRHRNFKFYLSLSAFCLCLCFPITVETKNATNNKLQTGLIEEAGEISLECRGMNEKGAHRVLARDYFSDSDWYGSDSSWLFSQIKIIETMKLFSAKLLGPN